MFIKRENLLHKPGLKIIPYFVANLSLTFPANPDFDARAVSEKQWLFQLDIKLEKPLRCILSTIDDCDTGFGQDFVAHLSLDDVVDPNN